MAFLPLLDMCGSLRTHDLISTSVNHAVVAEFLHGAPRPWRGPRRVYFRGHGLGRPAKENARGDSCRTAPVSDSVCQRAEMPLRVKGAAGSRPPQLQRRLSP